MGEEKKEALEDVILKAIGADPKDVKAIEIVIKYEPSKTKVNPEQG